MPAGGARQDHPRASRGRRPGAHGLRFATGHAAPLSGFSISINVTSDAEAERIYKALSEGGKVFMPLDKTFWAKKFAMFADRFGTPWMVNYEENAKEKRA
jgi:uncharacterized glyoxalase superfamily protein PhnB